MEDSFTATTVIAQVCKWDANLQHGVASSGGNRLAFSARDVVTPGLEDLERGCIIRCLLNGDYAEQVEIFETALPGFDDYVVLSSEPGDKRCLVVRTRSSGFEYTDDSGNKRKVRTHVYRDDVGDTPFDALKVGALFRGRLVPTTGGRGQKVVDVTLFQ